MDKLNKTIDENQCFYDDECIEFILDDLSETNRSAIMHHSTTCEECADLLNNYLDFDKSLTVAGQIKVSEEQLTEVLKAPTKEEKHTTKRQETIDLAYTLTPWPLGN